MLRENRTLRKKEGPKKLPDKVRSLKEGGGFKWVTVSSAIMTAGPLWPIYDRHVSHSPWQVTKSG